MISSSLVASSASSLQTCSKLNQWQQFNYCTYKAKLRKEINSDWLDLNRDGEFSSHFISPSAILFLFLRGHSLIFESLNRFDRSTFKLLLERGARADVKNNEGNSPLCLATSGGHWEVVELLIKDKADKAAAEADKYAKAAAEAEKNAMEFINEENMEKKKKKEPGLSLVFLEFINEENMEKKKKKVPGLSLVFLLLQAKNPCTPEKLIVMHVTYFSMQTNVINSIPLEKG